MDRLVREQQLDEIRTTRKTFAWIRTSDLIRWLQSSKGLFWISGKPASGKSTLVNYLIKSEETKHDLRKQNGRVWDIFYFFFDFRAAQNLRNSFEGFLRSLSHQVLKKWPYLANKLQNVKFGKNLQIEQSWSVAKLENLLKTLLENHDHCICFFIDGLDEFEGNKIELTLYIKSLTSANVKMCLASRPDPLFVAAFEGTPQLQMENLNRPGIESFVSSKLKAFFGTSPGHDSGFLIQKATEIANKSEGVFLWARFATFELIEGLTRFEDDEELQVRLDQVPPELKDIYQRIFSRRSSNEKSLAGIMLQLVIYARRPLLLEELFLAMELIRNRKTGTEKKAKFDAQGFRQRTLAFTGGVLESHNLKLLVQSSHNLSRTSITPGFRVIGEIVQVIHRTVQTYLEENGWKEILGTNKVAGSAENLWLEICTLQLKKPGTYFSDNKHYAKFTIKDAVTDMGKKGSGDGNTPESAVTSNKPAHSSTGYNQELEVVSSELASNFFWEYSVSSLDNHARGYEKLLKISSFDRLQPVLSTTFVKAHKSISLGNRGCMCLRDQNNNKWPDIVLPLIYTVGHCIVLCFRDLQGIMCKGDVPVRPQKVATGIRSPDNASATIIGEEELASLTNFALDCAIDYPDSARFRILELCLNLSCHVHDDLILGMFLKGVPTLVSIVLRYLPQAPIEINVEGQSRGSKTTEQRLGPLYLVARRSFNDSYTTEILDLLLDRGEDVNALCGPRGTALHSHLEHVAEYDAEFVEIMVLKGADINASGPIGNPLEYVWYLANTNLGDRKSRASYPRAIEHLISLGAVNQKPDPNGVIPSVE